MLFRPFPHVRKVRIRFDHDVRMGDIQKGIFPGISSMLKLSERMPVVVRRIEKVHAVDSLFIVLSVLAVD